MCQSSGLLGPVHTYANWMRAYTASNSHDILRYVHLNEAGSHTCVAFVLRIAQNTCEFSGHCGANCKDIIFYGNASDSQMHSVVNRIKSWWKPDLILMQSWPKTDVRRWTTNFSLCRETGASICTAHVWNGPYTFRELLARNKPVTTNCRCAHSMS